MPAILLTLAVVVAAVAFYYRNELAVRLRPMPAVSAVRTVNVSSGVFEQTIRLTGTTAAQHRAYLRAPRMRGRRMRGGRTEDFRLVLRELKESGARVRKGDVVAVFDRQYMLNRLDDYRAQRVDQETNVERLLANLKITRAAHQQKIRAAKGTMDRAALDLKTIPVRPAIQAELFRLAFAEAQMQYNALLADTKYVEASEMAQIRKAQLDLQEAEVEFRRAEANVDKLTVRAPIDGLVMIQTTIRHGQLSRVEVGDELHAGQLYMEVADPRSMIVEARANQVDVRRLRIGARADARFDAFAGLELPARVVSISPLAKSHGWRGSYVSEVAVNLKLERMDPRVIPSLSVGADVVLLREQNATLVPREAIFQDPGESQAFAFVQASNRWEKRELELGPANNVVAVVRSGLNEGEVVAAQPPYAR